jgi:hypothetical protein
MAITSPSIFDPECLSWAYSEHNKPILLLRSGDGYDE